MYPRLLVELALPSIAHAAAHVLYTLVVRCYCTLRQPTSCYIAIHMPLYIIAVCSLHTGKNAAFCLYCFFPYYRQHFQQLC